MLILAQFAVDGNIALDVNNFIIDDPHIFT